MPFKAKIETPLHGVISDLVTPIRGWVSGPRQPQEISIALDDRTIPVSTEDRPDVRRALPGNAGTGFRARLDFRSLPSRASKISLVVDGKKYLSFQIDRKLIEKKYAEWITIKIDKISKIIDRLKCPICGGELKRSDIDHLNCLNCHNYYKKSQTLIEMLPKTLIKEFKLSETDNISAHPYPEQALKLFHTVRKSGGLILDIGSGDQSYIDSSIICTEIVPYAATDVLAVGQRLPFKDASFDAVYSNAVLEHVTDPFKCAEEMMRVLKPGGRIFCSVPFLQPEHGYPHHYYNMTQDGISNLFTRFGAVLDEQAVPDWGHPLIAAHWMISSYLKYLPENDRNKLNSISISDFLKLKRNRGESIFANLSNEGRRVLSCTNYAIFTK